MYAFEAPPELGMLLPALICSTVNLNFDLFSPKSKASIRPPQCSNAVGLSFVENLPHYCICKILYYQWRSHARVGKSEHLPLLLWVLGFREIGTSLG